MKKVLSMLLTASLALGLVACSSNAGGGASSSAPAASSEAASSAETEASAEGGEEAAATLPEGTTVTIWHQYTEGQQEYITQVVADFNEAHPEVTVVEEYQPGSGSEFQDKVYQAVMAGNGPDIIIHYASEAAKYVADDKVVDLSGVLSAETLAALDAADPGFKAEATSFADGKLHILPIVSSGPILFYNKAVYEELGLSAPQTWDELIANCEAVREAHPDMAGFAFDSEVDGCSAFIMQTGNQDFDAEGVYFNTEDVAAMLQMYQDNIANGNFTNTPIDNYFSNNFNQGLLGAYIGSVAGVPYLQTEFGTGPVPQGGAVNWTPAWNRGIIIFNYDDEARAQVAGAFADYFASPEVNAGFCIAANYPAVFPETLANADYQAYAATVVGWDQLHPEYAGAFPAVTTYTYARNALRTLMSEVASGVDVQEALDNAVTYIEDELANE